MKTFSAQQFASAKTFLERHGWPLDQASFAAAFEAGNTSKVLTELRRYQNRDGGFGHGLEPDVRLTDSSVIATTIALQTLAEHDADAGHPMVRRVVTELDLG